jgi:hypothetical protein
MDLTNPKTSLRTMSAHLAIATDLNLSEIEAFDRLVRFEVRKLFGEYTYEIPLKVERHVTAIIAPNGSGKTICLRLIDSLFSKRWSFFAEIEFESVEFLFASGHRVRISKDEKVPESEGGPLLLGLVFTISGFTAQPITWRPGVIDSKAGRFPLERYLSFLTRRGSNQFSHDYTGAIYTFQEAVETFYSSIPDQARSLLYGEEPKLLGTLIKNIDCHLIEAQRLLILKKMMRASIDPGDLPNRHLQFREKHKLFDR